jgi:hypothetical protein
VIGLLFTVFGVIGLLAPKEGREVQYTEREFFWMSLAGVGNIVAAALLLNNLLSG